MYIEGCILPVTFEDFRENAKSGAKQIKKGDTSIQRKSEGLMSAVRSRYDALKTGKSGRPTITIAARLPAVLEQKRTTAYA
jgi:hypothetical protein